MRQLVWWICSINKQTWPYGSVFGLYLLTRKWRHRHFSCKMIFPSSSLLSGFLSESGAQQGAERPDAALCSRVRVFSPAACGWSLSVGSPGRVLRPPACTPAEPRRPRRPAPPGCEPGCWQRGRTAPDWKRDINPSSQNHHHCVNEVIRCVDGLLLLRTLLDHRRDQVETNISWETKRITQE